MTRPSKFGPEFRARAIDLYRSSKGRTITDVGKRVFRSGGRPDPAQVVTFVEAHRHTFGVAPLLAAIGEPVSTFYHRTSREPSARAAADAPVVERIEAIWSGRAAATARHATALLALPTSAPCRIMASRQRSGPDWSAPMPAA